MPASRPPCAPAGRNGTKSVPHGTGLQLAAKFPGPLEGSRDPSKIILGVVFGPAVRVFRSHSAGPIGTISARTSPGQKRSKIATALSQGPAGLSFPVHG